MADNASTKTTPRDFGRFKPITAVVGTAFVASLAAASFANADSPFAAKSLDNGYDQLAKAEGEGKCGEGKCGEGKCGEGKADDAKADAEGKCGEGKCGEGKCGEGKADDAKADAEGKCGEGKCGEAKDESEGKCGGAA